MEIIRRIALTLVNELSIKLTREIIQENGFEWLFDLYRRAVTQQKNDKNKVYSIFEPQVKCIAKGKEHVKYEFGNKAAFVKGLNIGVILAVKGYDGAMYDGDTVELLIDMAKKLYGYTPKVVVADLGYRGRGESHGAKIITSQDLKNLTEHEHGPIISLLEKRGGIEGIISHLKNDHRLGRNQLKDEIGDRINPVLAAAGFNLVKFARIFAAETKLFVSSIVNGLRAIKFKKKYPDLLRTINMAKRYRGKFDLELKPIPLF